MPQNRASNHPLSVVLLISALCLSVKAEAATAVGEFLSVPSDPKSVACGESIMALTDSPAAMLSNPCGMLNLYQAKLSVNEVLMWEDMKYHFIGLGLPSKYGNIGLGISYLDYGNINGVQVDGVTPVSLSNISDLIATMNYVYPFRTDVPISQEFGGVGLNVKFIQSRVDKFKADTLALDLGFIYKLPLRERIFSSVIYKNMGASLKYYGESDSISPSFAWGFKWEKPEWSDLFILWDTQKNIDLPSPSYSYGAGFEPFYGISLWGGWKDNAGSLNSGVRFGFGIDVSNYRINYSLAPMKEFGTMHYFALEIPVMNIADKNIAYDYYTNMHFQEAQNKYFQGDYVESRQILEDILGIYPNHVEAKKLLEKISYELDKIESGKKVLVRTLITKGQIELEKGSYAKAKDYFENAVKIDSTNIEAIDGLSNAERLIEESKFIKHRRKLESSAIKYYSKGDLINAKEAFKEIIKGDAEDYNAKRFIEEIDSKLSKMNVVEVNDFFLKGAQLFKKGNYEESKKYLDAVIIAAPTRYDVQDLANQCEERIKLKAIKGRDTDPEKERIRAETDMKSKYLKALSYLEDSKFELSYQTFNESAAIAEELGISEYNDKIIKSKAKIVEILSEKNLLEALAEKDKGNFEDAIEYYNKILIYDPNHALAIKEISVLSEEQAKKYFEEGMAYYSNGDSEKAKESFTRSLKFKPDYKEAQLALGKLQ